MPQIAYNERKVRALQKTYTDQQAARAVLDYCATRDSPQNETEIDSLARRIVSIDRGDVLGVMRLLQQLELGRVYQGRRGRKTRFVWAAPMNQVGLAAQGQLSAIDELEDETIPRGTSSEPERVLRSDKRVHSSESPAWDRSGPMPNTAALNLTINVNLMSKKARVKLAELLMVLDAEDVRSKSTATEPTSIQQSHRRKGRR